MMMNLEWCLAMLHVYMGLSRFMNCRQELDPLIDTETELMLMETNLETSFSTRGGFINRSKTVVFSKDEIQITHSSSHNKNMFIRNGCIIYNGRRYLNGLVRKVRLMRMYQWRMYRGMYVTRKKNVTAFDRY